MTVNLRSRSELLECRASSISVSLVMFLSVSDIQLKVQIERVKVHSESQSGGGSQIASGMDGEVRVVALVRKEWRNASGFRKNIVVSEFSEVRHPFS